MPRTKGDKEAEHAESCRNIHRRCKRVLATPASDALFQLLLHECMRRMARKIATLVAAIVEIVVTAGTEVGTDVAINWRALDSVEPRVTCEAAGNSVVADSVDQATSLSASFWRPSCCVTGRRNNLEHDYEHEDSSASSSFLRTFPISGHSML